MVVNQLKGRLKTARRGHKLLKDKRDELMRQFMDVVKLNKQLRISDEEGLTKNNDPSEIYPYGFAQTSGELDDALDKMARVFEDMLKLAEVEKTMQLLAEEIEKTRRRVNALEYVMIPELERNIKYISMKLEENENSTKVRLLKVKEMVLQDAHKYKQ